MQNQGLGVGERVGWVGMRAVYGDGGFLARANVAGPVGESRAHALVSANIRNEVERVVAHVPADSGTVSARQGNAIQGWSIVHFPRPLSDVAQDGRRVATAVTALGRDGAAVVRLVVVQTPGGDTLVAREFRFSSTAMPPAARDSLVSPLKRRATANPVAAELLRKVRAVLPRHYPPVRDLRLGLDETIWIERHASTGAIFQMLDARGAAVLEVALPRGARLAQANRTHVWVVEHDDDGVPSVVRHRILARR